MDRDQQNKELLGSLEKLYTGGDFSDLTIACGEETYLVHKAVLCPQSDFFDRICKSPFKEGRENHIDLSDDDPRAVKAMIYYFYHLDYTTDTLGSDDAVAESTESVMASDYLSNYTVTTSVKKRRMKQTVTRVPTTSGGMGSGERARPSDLVQHVNVYAIGEQYNIGGLKSLTKKKFANASAAHWNTPQYLEAVHQVYRTTVESDRGLRNLVLQTLAAQTTLLRKDEMKAVLQQTSQLTYELLIYKETHNLTEFGSPQPATHQEEDDKDSDWDEYSRGQLFCS
ncbi:hypothetical protein F5Y17DRAFT_1853 [Xylariaceae sp. FL0594]|nr:hypothetical protein F5Y17DRAFT_1853 [Xylariaceae sp. FL0594]